MKSYIIILFLLTASFSFSQEKTENLNTIENQFETIYRSSTTYQVYKVISKEKYQNLKLNVLDSLKSNRNTITQKELLLNTEKDNIEKTKNILAKTQLDLNSALKQANSISLFGLELSKLTYNLLLWFIITLLILSLSYFIFKFSRSNVLTKKAKNDLIETEQEFEQHRKKTIEREQKLRRQLQDEINKHRNI